MLPLLACGGGAGAGAGTDAIGWAGGTTGWADMAWFPVGSGENLRFAACLLEKFS